MRSEGNNNATRKDELVDFDDAILIDSQLTKVLKSLGFLTGNELLIEFQKCLGKDGALLLHPTQLMLPILGLEEGKGGKGSGGHLEWNGLEGKGKDGKEGMVVGRSDTHPYYEK
jgi:hypothetical protein